MREATAGAVPGAGFGRGVIGVAEGDRFGRLAVVAELWTPTRDPGDVFALGAHAYSVAGGQRATVSRFSLILAALPRRSRR